MNSSIKILISKIQHFWFNPNYRTRKMNRNVIYSFILKGLGILISLLLVPLTLDYLDKYEYGIWITLNSVLTWINVLDIGLGNGLRNKLAECIATKDFKLGKIYVSTTFALLSLISLGLCIIFLIINCFIDWNIILNIENPIHNLNTIVNMVLICLSINFTIRTIGLIYLSYQETFVNSLLTVLGAFVSLIWIYLLTIFSSPSLMYVAIAFSVSPIIVYIFAIPYTFYHKYPEIRPSIKHIKKKYVKSLGGLGVKFFILQVACLMLFLTSNLLISNIFSPAEVTPYSISFKYFNVVTSVFMIIIGPMWSGITDAYVKRDVIWLEQSMNKIRKIFFLCVLIIGIMILSAQPIYNLWIGHSVDIPFALNLSLAFFNIVYIWCSLYSTWCNGVGHLKIALYTMCTAAIVYIPVCLLVTKIIGLPGVATALGLSLLVPAIGLYRQYDYDLTYLKS